MRGDEWDVDQLFGCYAEGTPVIIRASVNVRLGGCVFIVLIELIFQSIAGQHALIDICTQE